MNDTGYVIQNYVAGICCSHTTMAFEGMTYWHYQKFQDRYICSESEFCKANQHCKKMSQGKENRECVELQQLEQRCTGIVQNHQKMGSPQLGKRLHSYDWNEEQLVNKTLVKDLPQT